MSEPTLAEEINSAFRDYAVEGVPASGAHEPVKAEIRAALLRLADEGGGGGGVPEPEPIPLTPFSVPCMVNPPMENGETLFTYVFVETVTFAADLDYAEWTVIQAPTVATEYYVKKNGTTCGTILFGTDGSLTLSTPSSATVTFVSGDVMTFECQASPDADAAFSLTLKGDR